MGAEHDLVVVGAGHAGVEAAAAAARLGARVAVVTLDRRTVGQMPCNPAVGGVGKGHLVVELDALGGVQGWAADRAGLAFKLLNRSRGPAVWGPRAQVDKGRYRELLGRLLAGLAGVTVIEGEAVGLLGTGDAVRGVVLGDGSRVPARAVILTTGTFLGGLLHTGPEQRPGGRYGERPSVGLGAALRARGLELRRFKTGTPPRLRRGSLALDRLEVQRGDAVPRAFSWRSRGVANRAACWVTRTPPELAEIVRENLARSPLFAGVIEGTGPRYCPSIEDKVVRFPHHPSHTVFLEPEGLGSESIYVNGLSTSLPRDVQERMIRAVPGLEAAEFLRYGYAVEYDVVAPGQVDHQLAVAGVPGLYVAGQLLGTSGYEEAAALGFMAGVNATRALQGRAPFAVGREEGYIGVLVDDVAGREHREPYRMLTSRAEHRLLLGVDSARRRLMARGRELGLVTEAAFHVERGGWERRAAAADRLRRARLTPDAATRAEVRRLAGVEITAATTWARLLHREDVDAPAVTARLPLLADVPAAEHEAVLAELRYDGYLERHRREAARVRRLRNLEIPSDLELAALPGLSREVSEQLARYRPRTVAEAERVPGMTPAAISLLVGRLARGAQ